MSGFAVAWLNLREAADQRARDPTLADQAAQWLQQDDDGNTDESKGARSIVVDLGAGTGSTLRALTGAGTTNIVWRLVDHDSVLLDEALRRHRGTCIIETYRADLNAIDKLPLEGARLVTASALFDLCPVSFVRQLVARLTTHHSGLFIGLYAALNYDGNTEWVPPHPLDAAVTGAFNQDQRRDKGMGAALGPDATSCLQATLQNQGFRVSVAASPWLLGPNDHALVTELIRGIAAAIRTGYGLDNNQLEDWLRFRLAHAASGQCTVGHLDLLALSPLATR